MNIDLTLFSRAVRAAIDSGKVTVGERETIRGVKSGDVKLAIVAANCPSRFKNELKEDAKVLNTLVYEFGGSSLNLGSICGKPFVVSMLGIIEPGDSNIFEVVKRR